MAIKEGWPIKEGWHLKECIFTAQGPQVLCFMDSSLKGSPCYRGGSCAICTGQASSVIDVKSIRDVCSIRL